MHQRLEFASLIAAVMQAGQVYCGSVNFDNLNTGVNPGNVLAASGVTFTTCQTPDAVAVGDIIVISNPVDQFEILTEDGFSEDAISSPNFAVGLGLGTSDVLMTFADPVNEVALFSDDCPSETPDLIRLLALNPTDKVNEFKVVAIHNGLDDASDFLHIGNYMFVESNTKFSAALFQTITEAEGFDNLTFEVHSNPKEDDCSDLRKRPNPNCLEAFEFEPQWVPVGCEVIDCCPCCPGECLDWFIRLEGDPYHSAILFFDNLGPETTAKLKIEGDAKWLDDQHLEVFGNGEVIIHGLSADPNARLPVEKTPRMTVESVVVVGSEFESRMMREKRVRAGGVLEVNVVQSSHGATLANSKNVYRYW